MTSKKASQARGGAVSRPRFLDAPAWTLIERKLIDTQNDAAAKYLSRYTREDGKLGWRDEWPGVDSSDTFNYEGEILSIA